MCLSSMPIRDGPPTQLQSEIQAEPNVVAVDLFDAERRHAHSRVSFSNTRSLCLSAIFPSSTEIRWVITWPTMWMEAGVVVQYGFSHYGPGQPYGS